MSAEPSLLSLKSRYYEGRIIGGSGSSSYGRDNFYQQTSIEMNLLSLETMGPETIEMMIMNGSEAVYTVDVTDEVLLGENRYALEQEMSASKQQFYDEVNGSMGAHEDTVASGSHSSTSPASINELSGMTYYMVHGVVGNVKEYGVKNADMLDVRYRITFKDGYVDEY